MIRQPFLPRLFAAAAAVSAAAAVLIFVFMAALGWPVLTEGTLGEILWGNWAPIQHAYGIRPMVMGTLCIAGLAVALAVPLSLGCAVFIQVTRPGFAGRWLLRWIQFMTAIPTVIYGFVGIFLLVPLIRDLFDQGSGLCILAAGLMLAVLIAPTMILFFVDGLGRVPQSYSRAVAALGGTKVQQLVFVMLPQAWPSILAGLVLGFGRAAGDTMIALMLAGNAVAMPESVLDSARTLTAHIALVIAADFDSPQFRTLFVCGLTLYVLTTLAVVAMRSLATKGKELP
jgi:phosphate transport system permease protein